MTSLILLSVWVCVVIDPVAGQPLLTCIGTCTCSDAHFLLLVCQLGVVAGDRMKDVNKGRIGGSENGQILAGDCSVVEVDIFLAPTVD